MLHECIGVERILSTLDSNSYPGSRVPIDGSDHGARQILDFSWLSPPVGINTFHDVLIDIVAISGQDHEHGAAAQSCFCAHA